MEQKEIKTLITQLCKGVVGSGDINVVQKAFQILLNFSEEVLLLLLLHLI